LGFRVEVSWEGPTEEAVDEAGGLGRQVGVRGVFEDATLDRRQALLVRLAVEGRLGLGFRV